MYRLTSKIPLNETVIRMDVEAPLIAKKAQPGQFVILRPLADSERIPLTIADTDPTAGTVTVIFQTVGCGTMELAALRENEYIHDFVGPLGCPTELEGVKKAIVVGGGVGSAIAFPIAKKLHQMGCQVHTILGFRSKDLVILEENFRAVSDQLTIVTDDGSYGEKALVTEPLRSILESGADFDRVFAIGPLVMMKFVSLTTLEYGVKTIVSMNPIMIDGTGMCGGCRLTVGGKTKFACVDGPDFDGHQVDFDEAMARGSIYTEQEAHARSTACNLMNKEVP